MAHTVTGKLNKAANEFQAGESVGFGFRLGEQYYDRATGQKEWTNYEGALFSKNQAQIEYYRKVLVEGAIIEVSCDQLKIKTFDGQNGQVLSLEMINAKAGFMSSQQSQNGSVNPQNGYQQQPVQQAPQQGYQQQPQRPAQAPAGNGYAQAQNQPMQQPAQQQGNGFPQDDVPF